MIKKYSCDADEMEKCDERIRIIRDDGNVLTRDDLGEHVFALWFASKFARSDSGAYDPYEDEYGDDGEATGNRVPMEGLAVFPVDKIDHGGVTFYLNGEGLNDPWDRSIMVGALYTDKEQYEQLMGRGTWMKKVGGKDATKEEFIEHLKGIARNELEELNLLCAGQCWRWVHERKCDYVKKYANGSEVKGHEWDELDGVGGYITDRLDDIDFPRHPDIEVFEMDDGLVSHQYSIPELAIRKEFDGKWKYLAEDNEFVDNPMDALVFWLWHDACAKTAEVVHTGADMRKHIIELDKIGE